MKPNLEPGTLPGSEVPHPRVQLMLRTYLTLPDLDVYESCMDGKLLAAAHYTACLGVHLVSENKTPGHRAVVTHVSAFLTLGVRSVIE